MDSTTGRGGTSAAGSTEPKTRTDASHAPNLDRDCTAAVGRRRDPAPRRGALTPAGRPGK